MVRLLGLKSKKVSGREMLYTSVDVLKRVVI